MRVAMYYNNKDVRLEEIPTPHIGSGELLVKVLASGICGSDVMEWYRMKKAPRVLGHERLWRLAKGWIATKLEIGSLSPTTFLVIRVNTV
jgi:D-arabinose 1-dehydrogenase-like Zn-dependent alcohol dehydrogenase